MAVATAPELGKRFYTPEEYLERERTAAFRSQYVAGEIVPMPGASEEHNVIVWNIGAALRPQLRGRDCRCFMSDMRVRTKGAVRFTYPDVVITCGSRAFDILDRYALVNPTVLVEVLSPSTEREDRGQKWASYQTLESLTEYLLISQDNPRVERFRRAGTGIWEYSADSSLNLESVGCVLNLRDIYEDIDFGAAGDGEVEDKTQG